MNPLGIHALVWVGGFSREECEYAVQSTRQAGFDILEIPALDPEAIDIAHTRAVLADHGVKGVCSLGLDPDCDISSPDAEVVRRGEERLAAALSVVSGIGGDFLGGVVYSALGKYNAPVTPEGRRNMVTALRRLAARAADAGITIGLEVVNRYESNVLNTVPQALELIEEIDAPNVMVHVDVYHSNIEEVPATAVRQAAAAGRLGYVHIGESHRGYLGTGTVDFGAFFGALREVGYTGPVTFESFSRAVVSPQLSNRLGVWRDLWADGADLARHAHAFITSHLTRS